MSKKIYTPKQRCDLANRVAQWCFDNTNSWELGNVGTGLAYLLWAITDGDKVCAFDATLENSGGVYDELVKILKANPNGLVEELVEGGFLIL